jgi:hypothetical protein
MEMASAPLRNVRTLSILRSGGLLVLCMSLVLFAEDIWQLRNHVKGHLIKELGLGEGVEVLLAAPQESRAAVQVGTWFVGRLASVRVWYRDLGYPGRRGKNGLKILGSTSLLVQTNLPTRRQPSCCRLASNNRLHGGIIQQRVGTPASKQANCKRGGL